MHAVNQELQRLQSLAKRYNRLESSVDSDNNAIQLGPFMLMTDQIKAILKSTPDSVLQKLRRDLPSIFISLASEVRPP
jgi:hypothetical protein